MNTLTRDGEVMDKEGVELVLKELGADKVKWLANSSHLQTNCPLAKWKHSAGSDMNPSCSIKVQADDTSYVNCFACGFKGTLMWCVREVGRLSGDEKIQALARQVAQLERQDVESMIAKAKVLYGPNNPGLQKTKVDLTVWDESEIAGYLGRSPKYVLDRGISIDVCREFMLGYDKKRGRVVIPVRNVKGQLVGLIGRAIFKDIEPV